MLPEPVAKRNIKLDRIGKIARNSCKKYKPKLFSKNPFYLVTFKFKFNFLVTQPSML